MPTYSPSSIADSPPHGAPRAERDVARIIWHALAGATARLAQLARTHVVLLAVLLLVPTILFLRKPDGFLNSQFWGEDAGAFFQDERAFGLSALWLPCQGYLVLAQRLVAGLGGGVDLHWLPTFYSLGAVAYTLLAAGFIACSRLPVRGRALLALALVAAPHGGEVFLCLTNVQWLLAPLLLMLALQQNPTARWQAVVDFTVLALVGLTGPFCILFLPLLVTRPLWFGRNAYNLGFAGVAICLAAIQIVSLRHFTTTVGTVSISGGQGSLPSIHAMLEFLGADFAGYYLLGRSATKLHHFLQLGVAALALICIFVGSTARVRWTMLALWGAAGVMFLAGLVRLGVGGEHLQINPGCRYFFTTFIFVAWTFVLGLSSPWRSGRWAAGVLCAMVVLAMLRHPRCQELTDYHWADAAAQIEQSDRAGASTRVMINPNWELQVMPRGKPPGPGRIVTRIVEQR